MEAMSNNNSTETLTLDNKQPIVISTGVSENAAVIKYGLSNAEKPSAYPDLVQKITKKWHYLKRGFMEDGLITDWGEIVNIWSHIFKDKIKRLPKLCDVLITESVRNSYTNTHRLIDIMFTELNINSICVMNENVLALFALNRFNGIVMNLAYEHTDCVPIMSGQVIETAVKTFHNKSSRPGSKDFIDEQVVKVFYKSVMKCDESFRSELVNNIVLYGKAVNYFGRILEKKLQCRFSDKGYSDYNVNVITPECSGENLSWIGGAMFCEQNTFTRDLWIYNDEWKECNNDEQWELSKSISTAFSNEFLKLIGIAYVHQLSLHNKTPIDIIRCILFCCNGIVYQDSELVIDKL
eukprot:91205_1